MPTEWWALIKVINNTLAQGVSIWISIQEDEELAESRNLGIISRVDKVPPYFPWEKSLEARP